MLTQYIQAAMRRAHYEIVESGRYWGEIPGLEGLWADGDTLEGCRQTLQECLEEWLLAGLHQGDMIPVIDDIDLNRKVEAA